ncbi:MAG: hypothetical protein ABH828_02085 [archaeon]
MKLEKTEFLELAEEAIMNSTSTEEHLIQGSAVSKSNPAVKCTVLIANNNHEKVDSANQFNDCNVRFNYYNGSESLFEAHSENIHPNFPHVHAGEKRFSFPLDQKLTAAFLSATTTLVQDAYDKFESEKKRNFKS